MTRRSSLPLFALVLSGCGALVGVDDLEFAPPTGDAAAIVEPDSGAPETGSGAADCVFDQSTLDGCVFR